MQDENFPPSEMPMYDKTIAQVNAMGSVEISALPHGPAKDTGSSMKRFLLFAGIQFPNGGWDDFKGSYDTRLEAQVTGEASLKHPGDWFQIVDALANAIHKTQVGKDY